MTELNTENNVEQLMNQLAIARSEINNLRQQLKSLKYLHQKECDSMRKTIEQRHCITCNKASNSNEQVEIEDSEPIPENVPLFLFSYIGKITTDFPEKRATPRQPGICPSIGRLVLDRDMFTNPEHSLEGLDDYSHMWILFHFHRNESSPHVRAKVAPPRLNGLRTGVFATRSPHRPCPIGLSLVKIERIEDRTVYFSGIDMVDGTPVLDIKPYIPQYDSPGYSVTTPPPDRLLDGCEMETSTSRQAQTSSTSSLNDSLNSSGRIGEREAPDGEEEEEETSHTPTANDTPQTNVALTPDGHIRVPSWIHESPVTALAVIFSDRALAQLLELQGSNASDRQNTISNILREDPRSVYLRARWGNQYYTFRIAELHVSCKFDDVTHSVTVFQIRNADSVTDE